MLADLDAGILDKRITIQFKTMTSDSEGGNTETWSDRSSCWAEVKPFGAKQVYEYQSLNVKASHKIKVRGNIIVQENDRIIFRTRVFEVLTVENEGESNVVKWVTCREVRN